MPAFRNNLQAFDLVITEMVMPNMTGKDLAKELMSFELIFLSSYVLVLASRLMNIGQRLWEKYPCHEADYYAADGPD